MVFIGCNIPHVWIADKDTHATSSRTLEMVFLQFTSDVLTQQMLSLPEFCNIKRAMDLSRRGIHIVGTILNDVSEIMLQLPYLKSFDRMLSFFRIMDIIGRSKTTIALASREYLKLRFHSSDRRLAIIHEYLMNNYMDDIQLGDIARMVNMAEGSLCRFFRLKMGMTLFEYLNKIKTDFACKLLMDPALSIMEVCFDSGFNNLSNFNKQFKKMTGLTPREYRKNITEIL
jgi:AraC-like DNA-binding protein